MDKDTILLIHPGGLGDVCLSESIFLSLREHFGMNLVGLGNKRLLDLFHDYFLAVEDMGSRKYLYLFSDDFPYTPVQRIVFIGKDRHGHLKRRFQGYSRDEVIFINMYPDGAFREQHGIQEGRDKETLEAIHIEDYQLAQLDRWGIKPCKKHIDPKPCSRAILYPEKGFTKKKWPPEHFFHLYDILKVKNVDVTLLGEQDFSHRGKDILYLSELPQVAQYFKEGGIFVSNDSGMAHFAGTSGLMTITIFTDSDSAVWHPRGRNVSYMSGNETIDEAALADSVLAGLS